jgi:hypothetical protein
MPEITAERTRRLYDELLAGGVSDPFGVVHQWAGRSTSQETRRLLGLDGDESMPQWEVELSRTISTTVAVHAPTAAAAAELAERHDFPLPPRDEWSGHKDWAVRVYDQEGEEVYEQYR